MRSVKSLFFFIAFIFSIGNGHSQSKNSRDIPFEKFKLHGLEYFKQISDFKKVLTKNIYTPSEFNTFCLYKSDQNIGVNFEIYDAILSINNFYYPITLGEDYKVEIKDIAGNDKIPEIVIYSGCLLDIDGCGQSLYIIRLVSKQNITITNFGEITSIVSEESNFQRELKYKNKYTHKMFLDDLINNKKQGKFILNSLTINYDYLLLTSYELSKYGFKKSLFTKKLNRGS